MRSDKGLVLSFTISLILAILLIGLTVTVFLRVYQFGGDKKYVESLEKLAKTIDVIATQLAGSRESVTVYVPKDGYLIGFAGGEVLTLRLRRFSGVGGKIWEAIGFDQYAFLPPAHCRGQRCICLCREQEWKQGLLMKESSCTRAQCVFPEHPIFPRFSGRVECEMPVESGACGLDTTGGFLFPGQLKMPTTPFIDSLIIAGSSPAPVFIENVDGRVKLCATLPC